MRKTVFEKKKINWHATAKLTFHRLFEKGNIYFKENTY